jgi:Reverse transcriptase (RNA-dependent DNA polymerase)
MKAGDEWKIAFRYPRGLFEFVVMSFSLTNTPSTFQRFMSILFKDYLGNGIEVYLDVILVYHGELKQREILVKKVINTLMNHKLVLKKAKCLYSATTVEFHGET